MKFRDSKLNIKSFAKQNCENFQIPEIQSSQNPTKIVRIASPISFASLTVHPGTLARPNEVWKFQTIWSR